jgi:hypothetical protein
LQEFFSSHERTAESRGNLDGTERRREGVSVRRSGSNGRETMKAVVQDKNASPDVLELREIDRPAAR